MARKTTSWWSIALIMLFVSVGAGAVFLWQPLSVSEACLPDHFVRVSGVAHVHTVHSDGSGSVEDVQRAAAESTLDFLLLTDHNTLDGKNMEGYSKNGVLTIIGTEISTHEGHLLAAGLPTQTYRFSGDGLDTLQDIQDSGGLAFAAHPEHPREGLNWTGWNLPGGWGIEILNGDTQWRAASWSSLVTATLLYPLNPTYAMLRLMTRPTALKRWDRILLQRRATGITGADAHGRLRLPMHLSLALPGYETLFQMARNHVLLDEPLSGAASTDTQMLLDALQRGRSYIGVDGLAPADRFYFVAEQNGETYTMGDVVAPGNNVRLRAGGAFPTDAVLTLLRDGVTLATSHHPLAVDGVGSGTYRIEVHIPNWNMPWIISNPIYIFDEASRIQRARAAMMPEPIVVEPTTILDTFDSETSFETASNETSKVNRQTRVLASGPDGSPAAHIEFELGTPTPDHPSPFASLVSYEHRDLSAYEGFAFSVKSDQTYRLWVQLRDHNPQAPDKTESWSASIKSSSRWRNVTLPFTRLKSVAPHTDRQLDLHDTEAIVFLVDIGGVAPGTSGNIWIDDLGVY